MIQVFEVRTLSFSIVDCDVVLDLGCSYSYYLLLFIDGTQGESVSVSCDDKLKIASRLASFQVDFIEVSNMYT